MKFSISWLKTYLDYNDKIDVLVDYLNDIGLEVEDVDDPTKNYSNFVIGKISNVEKHPNADKLKVCRVLLGKDTKTIVCGANNVREGIHVLVALEGAFLSAKSLKIKATKLRGIKSQGMICSLEEIGLETSSEGIAVLDEYEFSIPELGKSVAEIFNLNDTIIDLAITANRPDGMSVIGIAREISALLETKLTFLRVEKTKFI